MENSNVCESAKRESEVTQLYAWYLLWQIRNHLWEMRDLLPAVSDRMAAYNDLGARLSEVGISTVFRAEIIILNDRRAIACASGD